MLLRVVRDLRYSAIVKLVPLVIRGRTGIGSVMAETHISIVVRNSIAVVDKLTLWSSIPISFALDNISQIKRIEREVNVGVDFLAIAATRVEAKESALATGLLESLEIDDQNWWRLENLHLLGSPDVLLAFIAIPLVVVIKHLRLSELLEAVHKSDLLWLLDFSIIGRSFFLLSLSHTTQLLNEQILEVSGPDNVENDVLLASIIEETDVVFNSD